MNGWHSESTHPSNTPTSCLGVLSQRNPLLYVCTPSHASWYPSENLKSLTTMDEVIKPTKPDINLSRLNLSFYSLTNPRTHPLIRRKITDINSSNSNSNSNRTNSNHQKTILRNVKMRMNQMNPNTIIK